MSYRPVGPWIDLSPPMSRALAEWPGDKPYELSHSLHVDRADNISLGAVSMSLHTGSHADAPIHFTSGGESMESVSLDAYLGLAWVMDGRGRTSLGEDLVAAVDWSVATRALIRTDAWLDRSRFPSEIPVATPEAIQYLGETGVRLYGVDLPSVDPIQSQTLENHRLLNDSGILILEGLDLSHTEPGLYFLCAQPLPFVGGDASPVRAVARKMQRVD